MALFCHFFDLWMTDSPVDFSEFTRFVRFQQNSCKTGKQELGEEMKKVKVIALKNQHSQQRRSHAMTVCLADGAEVELLPTERETCPPVFMKHHPVLPLLFSI
uniref:PPUP8822 n=1 Tax=Poeciliopsis prolifica TaxID=188132 RepID=A0A0S7ER04_9TELE